MGLMTTAVTEGIKITVQSKFEPGYTLPLGGPFLFAYHIIIENQNPFPVQLLHRHWFIFDSNGAQREVQGKGVVGLQPVIEAGARYTYNSACDLFTEIGKMHGTYQMRRLDSSHLFTVVVPEFRMEAPHILN